MDRPLGVRILRYGLKAATRAANEAVDRMIRRDDRPVEPGFVATPRLPWRRAPQGPVDVMFEGEGGGVVEPGTTILEAARQFDVDLDSFCGGNCSCGTCRVRVIRGDRLSKPDPLELMVLGSHASTHRLACQTRLFGPATILLPEW